jgi:hypothetical protein
VPIARVSNCSLPQNAYDLAVGGPNLAAGPIESKEARSLGLGPLEQDIRMLVYARSSGLVRPPGAASGRNRVNQLQDGSSAET